MRPVSSCPMVEHRTLNAPRFEAQNPTCCVILDSIHSACALQLLQPKFSEPLILLSLSHFIVENSTGFSSSNDDQHPRTPLPRTHHLCYYCPGGLRCHRLSPLVLQPPSLYLCPSEHPVLSPDTSWRRLFMTHTTGLCFMGFSFTHRKSQFWATACRR